MKRNITLCMIAGTMTASCLNMAHAKNAFSDSFGVRVDTERSGVLDSVLKKARVKL